MNDQINLRLIREKLGISQQDLADQTGLPKPRIAKWEERGKIPKKEDYDLIAKFFEDKNIDISTIEDNQTADNIPSFKDKSIRKPKINTSPYLVPFIDLSAQAGYRNAYSDIDYIHTLKHYPILPDVDPTGATWRYFQVAGDSMEPVLNDGDTVLTSLVIQDDWDNLRNYYTHVIVTHTELLIKDLFKTSDTEWILLSQNPHYEPRILKIEDVRQLFVVRRRVQNKLPKNRIYNIADIKKQLKR